MIEIACTQCGWRVGWMIDCGPHGSIYCDDCKEEQDAKDEEARLELMEEPRHDA